MHVVHGLPGLRPGVEHDPVPALCHAKLAGYHGCLRRDFVKQAVAGLGERGQIGVVLFRDHEHMHRALRVYVLERNGARAFQDRRGRDLSRRDATEQAVSHAADINRCRASTAADIYGCSTANPRRTTPLARCAAVAVFPCRQARLSGGGGDANSARIVVGAVEPFRPTRQVAWLCQETI
jgi:hypothetical protein